MSSLIFKRPRNTYSILCQLSGMKTNPVSFFSPSEPECRASLILKFKILNPGFHSISLKTIKTLSGSHFGGSNGFNFLHLSGEGKETNSWSGIFNRNKSGFSSSLLLRFANPLYKSLVMSRYYCILTTLVAAQLSTSDGLTLDEIVANNWTILDETESDWKSHAAAIALSIQVIRKRLQWEKLMVRLDLLSTELNNADLWDDPVRAGKISREHGSLMAQMKGVKTLEKELLEHIDMIKLAHEENDSELELESLKALLCLRRDSMEKELEALLAGEQDYCSCYIEVQAGAGGTESMDWAKMVMQMYKLWGQRRGYGVTVVEEMPGEIAGIKRATIRLDGEYAFGYAKSEVGVHRLISVLSGFVLGELVASMSIPQRVQ